MRGADRSNESERPAELSYTVMCLWRWRLAPWCLRAAGTGTEQGSQTPARGPRACDLADMEAPGADRITAMLEPSERATRVMACTTRRPKYSWGSGRRAASQRRCLSTQRGTFAQPRRALDKTIRATIPPQKKTQKKDIAQALGKNPLSSCVHALDR
jgi:hypothetical protein